MSRFTFCKIRFFSKTQLFVRQQCNPARAAVFLWLAVCSYASWCEESGYSAGFAYTGDALKNMQGGAERASAYVDLLSLYGDIDSEKAWGHAGGTIHFDFLISHNTFSETVGDAQTTSNIDFDDGERLYQLWYEQQIGQAGSSVKAGLYDVNSEFDSIETAGLFVNGSHGAGIDWSQSGSSGPSFSPITGLALRGLWAIDPAWKLQAVVADGAPGDHNGRNRHTHIQLREDEGAMTAAEINFQPAEKMRLGLGGWYYTRQMETFSGKRDHSNGVYAFSDIYLGETANGSWSSFARIGSANEHVNQFGNYYGVGVVFCGKLINANDRLGLAFASADNGHAYLDSEALAGSQWDDAETSVELTYATKVTSGLSMQPNIQYIINPGTDPSLDNALVVGVRFQITADFVDVQHALNR